jgi:hypothetical protein
LGYGLRTGEVRCEELRPTAVKAFGGRFAPYRQGAWPRLDSRTTVRPCNELEVAVGFAVLCEGHWVCPLAVLSRAGCIGFGPVGPLSRGYIPPTYSSGLHPFRSGYVMPPPLRGNGLEPLSSCQRSRFAVSSRPAIAVAGPLFLSSRGPHWPGNTIIIVCTPSGGNFSRNRPEPGGPNRRKSLRRMGLQLSGKYFSRPQKRRKTEWGIWPFSKWGRLNGVGAVWKSRFRRGVSGRGSHGYNSV